MKKKKQLLDHLLQLLRSFKQRSYAAYTTVTDTICLRQAPTVMQNNNRQSTVVLHNPEGSVVYNWNCANSTLVQTLIKLSDSDLIDERYSTAHQVNQQKKNI